MSVMSLSTQERLQATKEVYPPKIIELLDIGATTTNKVRREREEGLVHVFVHVFLTDSYFLGFFG